MTAAAQLDSDGARAFDTLVACGDRLSSDPETYREAARRSSGASARPGEGVARVTGVGPTGQSGRCCEAHPASGTARPAARARIHVLCSFASAGVAWGALPRGQKLGPGEAAVARTRAARSGRCLATLVLREFLDEGLTQAEDSGAAPQALSSPGGRGIRSPIAACSVAPLSSKSRRTDRLRRQRAARLRAAELTSISSCRSTGCRRTRCPPWPRVSLPRSNACPRTPAPRMSSSPSPQAGPRSLATPRLEILHSLAQRGLLGGSPRRPASATSSLALPRVAASSRRRCGSGRAGCTNA